MKRTLALLDVTAMGGDAVCVAGIDLGTGETCRLNDPQPTRTMLARFGGFAPGDVIEVDWVPSHRLVPPHLEDGAWQPRSLNKVRRLILSEVVALIAPGAFASVEDAFGDFMYAGSGGNHAWEPGQGARSLATIRARYVGVEESTEARRVALRDDRGAYWRGIPFQDLAVRRHATECHGCAESFVRHLREEFDGNGVLVRVGLTRKYSPDVARPEGCWQQVTNIFARERRHFA